jgi:hypothetical protein
MPVTSTRTPSTAPIVSGMTSPRSAARAASERASVPDPSSGTLTIASVRSGLTVTSTGSDMRPVASAASRRRSMPACTAGAVTSSARTTTDAGSAPPGNAAWMRS